MPDNDTVKLLIELQGTELVMFLPRKRAKAIKKAADGKRASVQIESLENQRRAKRGNQTD